MTPIDFLRSMGCHEADHDTGVKFLAHLTGVARVLEAWGEPERLQLAGAFHSIYGTELFQDYSVSFARRDDIKQLIGPEAEALVYIFCTMDLHSLDKTLDAPAGEHCIMQRAEQGGKCVPLSDEQFKDLITVQLADWLEQVERYSQLPDPKLGWKPGDAWGHRRSGYRRMAQLLGGKPLAAWQATYAREPAHTRSICNDITPTVQHSRQRVVVGGH